MLLRRLGYLSLEHTADLVIIKLTVNLRKGSQDTTLDGTGAGSHSQRKLL